MQYYDYDDHGNLVIVEMGDPYVVGYDQDVDETTTSFHDHHFPPQTADNSYWSLYGSTTTATATATDGSGGAGSGTSQTTAAAQLASTAAASFSFGSFTTSFTTPESENVGSYSTTQTTAAPSSSPSSNPSSTQSSPSSSGPPPGPDHFHTAKLALAAIVPLVVLIFGAIAFIMMRKRKRQQFQQRQMKEMSMQPPTYPRTPEYSFIPQPPPPTIPSGTSPMVPPIIIAPMSAGSNSGYMTGMDTSDAVSVRDAHPSPAYNGYASVEDSEEPPPPYRPRSIAPASRNSSVRHPPVADGFYGTQLMAAHGQSHEDPFADPEASMTVANGRSPFADPGDNDDNVSEISDVEDGHDIRRRNLEVLSDVSDLSYQHEFHSMEDRINR